MDSPFVNEVLADSNDHQQPQPQQVDPVNVPDLNIAGHNSSSSIIPEKVIGLTESNGQLMILLKLKGLEKSDLIADKEAYILWPQLVLKFYEERLTWHECKGKFSTIKSHARPLKKHRERTTAKNKDKSEKKDEIEDAKNDVDEDGAAPEKVPERILGATDASGQLHYLLKWHGVDEADFIVANEAYRRCPQLLLKWYEERITWKSSN